MEAYSPPIASYTAGGIFWGQETKHTVDFTGFISAYSSPPLHVGSSGIPGFWGCDLLTIDAFLGGGSLGGMSKYRVVSPMGVQGPSGVLGTLEPPRSDLKESPPGLSYVTPS